MRFRPSPPDEIFKLVAFVGVGLVAFIVYLLLVTFAVTIGIAPVAGATVGFVGGTTVSFFGNCRFVFRSCASTLVGRRFVVITLAGFMLNILLASLLTRWGVHYAVMTVIIFVVVSGFNYGGHRFWTFSETRAVLEA